MKRQNLVTSSLSINHIVSHHRRFSPNFPATSIAPWNSLITDFSRKGFTFPALRSFNEMQLNGLKPDAFTLSYLLKSSSNLQETQFLHSLAVKTGSFPADYSICGLIHNYSKAGDMGSAEKCFTESSALDPVVWTAMVSGYVKNGELDKALRIFGKMWGLGLKLNEFCLSSVLAALADDGCEVRQGMQIHGLGVKMGFLPFSSTPLCNALLSMYCRCGTKEDGLRALDEIRDPDVVSWSTILVALNGVEAIELFRFLGSKGIEVNEYTIINLISAIGGDSRLMKCGEQIHVWCLKSGFLFVVPVGNALISMYGKCREIDRANWVFDEMVDRDIVTWNAIIAVHASNCSLDSVFGLFSQMRRHLRLEPNTATLASLSEAVSTCSCLNQAAQIHSYMIKSGHISDHRMVNTMIAVYGKLDRLKESKQIFDEADRRALVHINAMAATLVQAGYYSDAMKLFKATRRLEVEVDGSTVSVVLKACCGLTSLEQGRSVHSLALKLGIGRDKFVGSATIDNYCKCGSLDDATKAFMELPKGNLAIWNAMITGYAQHGYHDKAIEEFDKMIEFGLDPDEITFLGVLYSCCHSGLVKEAYYYFNSMLDNFGLVPSLEHYACVIDLLGRTGRLEEAKTCIDRMPIVPDARVWQSFLMACSAYRDVDLGKIAAEKLLELEPDNESAYVLLSSIYAALGMWDEVRRVRRGMREKTVCKEPGCSWIQVRGSAHSFFASGTSHPQTLDIYLMLEVLNKKMVVVGGHRTGDGSSLQDQESLAYHGLIL